MQKPEVPFFARFLEGQDALAVRTDVKGGKPPSSNPPVFTTQKYPSDDDEEPYPPIEAI